MMYVNQLNCNKSKLCNDHICHLMSQKKEIFCLQEPYYYRNRMVGIPKDYKVYGETNSRAAILAPSSFELIYVNEYSCKDITLCYMTSSNWYFASIYLDIHEDPVHPYFEKMVDYFNSINANAVFCIDTNSHSYLWNSRDENERGEKLTDFILSSNLIVLNEGSTPTWKTSRGESIIDVTLGLGNIERVKSWVVDTENFNFSDHRTIVFEIGGIKKPPAKLFPKINWELYSKTVKFEPVFYSQWDYKTIETESQRIEDIICNALLACTKYLPAKVYKTAWWTNELQSQKQEVIRLAKIKLRHPTAANIDSYASARKAFSKNVRKAKRAHWREFLESIDSPKNMTRLNKVISKSSAKNDISLLKRSDGTYTNSVKSTLELLMKTHLPGCEPVTQIKNKLPAQETVTCDKIFYDLNFDSFITEEKVKMAFDSFDPFKAPGPGKVGIPPKALQLLGVEGIRRITNLYKACIEIGYSPLKWRVCKLIFLAKPNKPDYSLSKAYRGISLMSWFQKGLEKLCLWEIEEKVLSVNGLSKTQHAFRRGYSTETALSAFVDKTESAILRNSIVLSVFCDINQAFDCLQTETILEKMRQKNVPEKILNWYKHSIQNRYSESSLKGETILMRPILGSQQGAIISPLSWNLVFEGFLDLHKSGPVQAQAFADDGVLYIVGKDPSVMLDLMQEALNKTAQWGVKNGLTFSAEKTTAMFFHRKYKWKHPNRKLKLSGVEINYTDRQTFLGLYFDPKLSFTDHINQKIAKVKKHLMLIRNAIGTMYGPSPKALYWAYNGIILPSLTYGSVVWARACSSKAIRDKLSKLNRLIACCMLPMRKGSPTEGLEVILNLPPLDLKIEQLALKAMLRVLPHNQTKWDGVGTNRKLIGHLKWGLNKLKELVIDPFNNDSYHSSLNVSRQFQVDFKSFDKGLPISESSTICYTDGSRMNDSSGYGLGITRGDILVANENGQLDSRNTVFQAEVYAIHKACVKLREIGTRDVTIFSDSQSALSAIGSVKIRSKVVSNCIRELNSLGNTSDVKLMWVKAHCDHSGNEYADSEAKLGTTNVDNLVKLALPKSYAIGKISLAMYNQWNSRWIASKDCRQTKIWFPVVNIKKSNHLLNLKRRDLGHMVQFITGHNRLNYQQNKIDPSVNPFCRFCLQEKEESWHLIGKCPYFRPSRRDIFKSDFLDLKPNPEWQVWQLKRFIQKKELKEMLNRETIVT